MNHSGTLPAMTRQKIIIIPTSENRAKLFWFLFYPLALCCACTQMVKPTPPNKAAKNAQIGDF